MISFTLTMPRNNSWNNKWSGDDKLYAVVKRLPKEVERRLETNGPFYHQWKDGWQAQIDCKVITAVEANKIRKKSLGFCGYEWMIDNIISHGSAYAD